MKKISFLLVLSFFAIGAYSQTQIPENSTSPLYYKDGKIGIGTNNPGDGVSSDPNLKLHVNGGITLNTGHRLSLDQNYSVHGYLQYDSSLPDGRLLYYGYYGHRWHTSGGEMMRLTRSGNVGIGTTSPVEKLHVNGNITFYNGEQGNGLGTDVDGNLVFYRNAVSNNIPSMVINDESGNVGIGTTVPKGQLDIENNNKDGYILNTTYNTDQTKFIFKENSSNIFSFFYDGSESSPNNKLYIMDEAFGQKLMTFTQQTGNVGIGTSNPIVKLQVKGPSDVEAAIITSFSNLSSDNYSTGNWYRSFSGATYTNGNSGGIVNYLTYRSVYGGYLDYNGQGYGFYSQGHYPRMFMEVISGNHGTFGNLPGDSPIKNGYIYQQIKGPSAGPLASPVKATNTNSQWLWGVKSTGDIVVAGKIECREVKVTAQAGADFVFEADYALLPLMELEKFVREHKHLPEVASAKEMEEKGVNQSEMNQKLLQKIEELTLYVIEQQKQINELKKQITTEPSK